MVKRKNILVIYFHFNTNKHMYKKNIENAFSEKDIYVDPITVLMIISRLKKLTSHFTHF